jgi:hypothetical protein
MSVTHWVYYAKPTYTDGEPGIWAHFYDLQIEPDEYCVHVHIRDLVEPRRGPRRAAWVQQRNLILEYANEPSAAWLRNMITEGKAARYLTYPAEVGHELGPEDLADRQSAT